MSTSDKQSNVPKQENNRVTYCVRPQLDIFEKGLRFTIEFEGYKSFKHAKPSHSQESISII